jgi:hypothetical protein
MKPTPAEIRDAARVELVDEYGHLLEKTAPHKKNFARLAEVAKGIRSWFKDSSGSKSYIAQGDIYVCTLSPCENQTVIKDMQLVYDRLGHKKFIAACSITLGAMAEAGLSAGDIVAMTYKAQTGSRNLEVTKRATVFAAGS